MLKYGAHTCSGPDEASIIANYYPLVQTYLKQQQQQQQQQNSQLQLPHEQHEPEQVQSQGQSEAATSVQATLTCLLAVTIPCSLLTLHCWVAGCIRERLRV